MTGAGTLLRTDHTDLGLPQSVIVRHHHDLDVRYLDRDVVQAPYPVRHKTLSAHRADLVLMHPNLGVHQVALADHHILIDGVKPELGVHTLHFDGTNLHLPDTHHQLRTHLSDSVDSSPPL